MKLVYRLFEEDGFYAYKTRFPGNINLKIYLDRRNKENGRESRFLYKDDYTKMGNKVGLRRSFPLYLVEDKTEKCYLLKKCVKGKWMYLGRKFEKREEGERFMLEYILEKLKIESGIARYILEMRSGKWIERKNIKYKKIKEIKGVESVSVIRMNRYAKGKWALCIDGVPVVQCFNPDDTEKAGKIFVMEYMYLKTVKRLQDLVNGDLKYWVNMFAV